MSKNPGYSQIVTLDNLNTVYRSLKDDIKAILQVYKPMGDTPWKEISNLSRVEQGTVYTVVKIEEYADIKAPESLNNGENLLCIKTINFMDEEIPNPDNSEEYIPNPNFGKKINWGNTNEDKKDPNWWSNYWKEIGNIMALATEYSDGYMGCHDQRLGGHKIIYPSKNERNPITKEYPSNSNAAIIISNTYTKTQLSQDSLYIGMPYNKNLINSNNKTPEGEIIQVPAGDTIEKIDKPEICTGNLYLFNGNICSTNALLNNLIVNNQTDIPNLIIEGKKGKNDPEVSLKSETSINILPNASVKLNNLTVANKASVNNLLMEVNDLKSASNIYLTGNDPSSIGKLTANVTVVNELSPSRLSDDENNENYTKYHNINLICDEGTEESPSKIYISSGSKLGVVQIKKSSNSEEYNFNVNKLSAEKSVVYLQEDDPNLSYSLHIENKSQLGQIQVNNLKADTLQALKSNIINNEGDSLENKLFIKSNSNLGKVFINNQISPEVYSTKANQLTASNSVINLEGDSLLFIHTNSDLGKISLSAYKADEDKYNLTAKELTASNSNISITDASSTLHIHDGSNLGKLYIPSENNCKVLNLFAETSILKCLDSSSSIYINNSSKLGILQTDETTVKKVQITNGSLVNNDPDPGSAYIKDTSKLGVLISDKVECAELQAPETTLVIPSDLGSSSIKTNVCKIIKKGSSENQQISIIPAQMTDKGSTDYGLRIVKGDATSTTLAWFEAGKVFNAVWNDIADAIDVDILPEPGYCYYFDGKHYNKTNKYCQKGIIGIHSDTYGYLAGVKGNLKELHTAIAGFVLAYVDKNYPTGTPLTCTKDGKLTKMKKLDLIIHPERLVGTYWKSELEKEWNGILVNGRHWIKVK